MPLAYIKIIILNFLGMKDVKRFKTKTYRNVWTGERLSGKWNKFHKERNL
jgi:hypothetical protein